MRWGGGGFIAIKVVEPDAGDPYCAGLMVRPKARPVSMGDEVSFHII
jgi:hypothetical protein